MKLEKKHLLSHSVCFVCVGVVVVTMGDVVEVMVVKSIWGERKKPWEHLCTSTHKEEGGGSRIQNKITILKIDTNTNCKTKHKKH
jgi:hypothetical protein